MTEAAYRAPSENAGTTLPYDAKAYQNFVDAVVQQAMHRVQIPLFDVAGTNTITATAAVASPETSASSRQVVPVRA